MIAARDCAVKLIRARRRTFLATSSRVFMMPRFGPLTG